MLVPKRLPKDYGFFIVPLLLFVIFRSHALMPDSFYCFIFASHLQYRFYPNIIEQIVVYAKTWCGHCKKTKELLAGDEFKGVDISIHDIDTVEDGPALQRALADITGITSVPQVFVNGVILGGNDATQEAYKNGELLQKVQA
jgi:glutaredoxin 3